MQCEGLSRVTEMRHVMRHNTGAGWSGEAVSTLTRTLDILIMASSITIYWGSSQVAPDLVFCDLDNDCCPDSFHLFIFISTAWGSGTPAFPLSALIWPFSNLPWSWCSWQNSLTLIHSVCFECLTHSRSSARILRIKKMKEKINLTLKNPSKTGQIRSQCTGSPVGGGVGWYHREEAGGFPEEADIWVGFPRMRARFFF